MSEGNRTEWRLIRTQDGKRTVFARGSEGYARREFAEGAPYATPTPGMLAKSGKGPVTWTVESVEVAEWVLSIEVKTDADVEAARAILAQRPAPEVVKVELEAGE